MSRSSRHAPRVRKSSRRPGTEKLRVWIENHLLAPRFDNPDALMPDLQISEARATFIAESLVGAPRSAPLSRAKRRLASIVRRNANAALLVALSIGVVSGGVGVAALGRWRRGRRRR